MTRPLQPSRRQFLRGLGVSLALPWLESVATSPPPVRRRFAFLYTPNGFNQTAFLPKKSGASWATSPTLAPLASMAEKIALVTGLDRQFVGGTGVHAQCGSCWLSSSPPQETLDGGFPTNITLDQLLARELGRETLLPSLELSCNDFTDNKETRYYESISWLAPGYAANVERNPRAVFQRLFGRPDAAGTRSVLDVVLADAKSLESRLGLRDREKLGEYLESVRATEIRIERAEAVAARLPRVPLDEPAGIPERRGDYLRLQAELFVLAFQNDLTRVASLVVDPERWDSPRMYHGLFDRPQNHHVLTHTKGAEAAAAVARIDRFHVEFLAHVLTRLASVREGDGSLLDSTTVVFGSGISDGDSHNYSDLQVLLAGGGVRAGHSHHRGRRPLADLWLGLARMGGLTLDRFADSQAAIEIV